MKKSKTSVVYDRRGFLKGAGAGAAAGAALLTDAKKAQAGAPSPKEPALYRESDHIRRYYELAR
jgi:hypothetical protein